MQVLAAMMLMRTGWVGVALGLVTGAAVAEEPWETIQTGPLTIRTRPLPGTQVKEVWAEGAIEAEVQDIQSAILDAEAYPRFMPYVKETRVLPDGSSDRLVYTRLDLPFVSPRDYVVRVSVDERVGADGGGEFKNSWRSAPDAVPARRNVIRLRHNQGSWHVVPLREGRSWVSYRFSVDPGGWVPGFALDMGNRSGVQDAFRAVGKEARRRAEQRRTDEMGVGGSGR